MAFYRNQTIIRKLTHPHIIFTMAPAVFSNLKFLVVAGIGLFGDGYLNVSIGLGEYGRGELRHTSRLLTIQSFQ